MTHLAQCLDLLLQSQHDSPALRLAIFYHDIVYDTHCQDNESASAELAGEQLAILGCPATRWKESCSLILATAHLDNTQAVSMPTHVLCDIDLATLGSKPDDYDLYARQIRSEYDWVSSAECQVGRSAVLRSFLKREHLYRTEEFCARFESQARANIQRELDQLADAQERSGRHPESEPTQP